MPTYSTYKLSEIACSTKGKKPKSVSKEKTDGFEIPYVDIKAFEKGIINNYTDGENCTFCKPDDVLIVWDGARCGFVGRGVEGAIGSTLAKISSEKYTNDFLFYFLQSKYKVLNSNPRGVGIPHIEPNLLWNFEIPDVDKTTQRAIVTRIETLFAELDKAVQHLRTAQQQLKTYRQAVLKAAFEECDSYEKITNCFDVTGGLTKNSQREKFSIKMPYLRVANVYYNRLDLSEIKEIGVQESEIKDKLLKKEDLLFVEENGSKEQIGRVAVWDGSIENCLHQNHIIKGRPLGTMLSKFALYYFISDFGREQILKVASSTSGLYTLSTEKVRNLKVPSCSLTEQHRIVQEIESRLSQATASETYIENALQQAEALRQSILKKAFSGELV